MKLNKSLQTVMASLLILLFFGHLSARAVPPADETSREPKPPQIFLDTTYTPATGTSIFISAGGDLQAAIDSAVPGDEIVLEAGATYEAPADGFYLRPKTGTGWITIRTSNMEGISEEGARINPALHAAAMPKIVSRSVAPALVAASPEGGGVPHHYRLVGIEITLDPGVTLNYGLVTLGGTGSQQTSLDQVPHDLILDRCYVHGHQNADLARGIALNSARSAVIDSYISECHGRGFDTQAIAGWNGPGPFKIVNNYLEGAGENVMFGGADPAIPNLVPSDIEIRRNHLFKPLSWKEDDPGYAGEHWAVKNLFELKNARRVLIEGNLFEHNWADAQNGFAILFTVRNQDGGAPWSVVEDVRFSRNILRHAAGGINILGRDYIHPSQQTKRIKIDNNLMYEIGGRQWGINGRFLQLNETVNVTVNHNTVLHTGNVITAYGAANEGFVFTNNLMPHNEYGVIGDSTPTGTWTLNRYFPSVQFKKNVIVGGEANRYPGKKNYYPATLDDVGFIDWRNGNYRLQGRSPYKGAGKKQKDIGANMDEIEAAIAGRIDPPGF